MISRILTNNINNLKLGLPEGPVSGRTTLVQTQELAKDICYFCVGYIVHTATFRLWEDHLGHLRVPIKIVQGPGHQFYQSF